MKRRTYILISGAAVAAALATVTGFALTRTQTLPTPPFLPPADTNLEATRLLTAASKGPRAQSMTTPRLTRHFEYVFPDGEMDVYDIDHGFRLVERTRIPQAHAVRGVAASPKTHSLYLAVGGDGGSEGSGSLLKFNLLTKRVVWQRRFPTGIDSPAITPDGKTLYLPTGELASGDVWWVVDASSGRVLSLLHGGTSPHNTVMGPDGSRVYLAPRNGDYLSVASTRTNEVVRQVGPLKHGVRPFTIDGRQRFAYTTATGFLGFQASSLSSGHLLYTVPIPGFTYDPSKFSPTAPSHGIALSPDSTQVWVVDAPNGYVHEFDVSGLPDQAPRHLADVRLSHPMEGDETPCAYDCARDGWLQESADGRFLFVGDSGDVVRTSTHRVVAFLPALRNSRYPLEIDWSRGLPVATTTRSSIGRR
jgi:DNA-binding beta-propeller fold protein YncE